MSLARLNSIIISGVVPFNFGMTVDSWQESYEKHGPDMWMNPDREPATWPDDEKARVNAEAAHERAIVDELMAIEDHDAFEQRLAWYLSQQEK